MNAIDCNGRNNELYTRQTKKLKTRIELTSVNRGLSLSVKLKPNQITTVISFIEATKVRADSSTQDSMIWQDIGKHKIIFTSFAGTRNLGVTIESYRNIGEAPQRFLTVRLDDAAANVFLSTLYATYYKALQQGKL